MKFWFEKGKMHLTVTSLQCQCLSWLMIDQGNLRKSKPTKTQNQIKRKPRWNGETRVTLRSWNGCKNSGKIWWTHHSTTMTPSRQERHRSTSSSSSSSSPTATSSENETREREDRYENDTSPVPVSSFNVDDRTVKPVVDQANQSRYPGVAARNQRKFGG